MVWKKKKSEKFIVQVAATVCFVWVVMLVINIGLKMAPPDSCKQAVSQTGGQDPVSARTVCGRGFQVCSPPELVLRPEIEVQLPATVAIDEKLKYIYIIHDMCPCM